MVVEPSAYNRGPTTRMLSSRFYRIFAHLYINCENEQGVGMAVNRFGIMIALLIVSARTFGHLAES
ncbi:MAG: hypothetical protein RL011_814 [Pseudomonadota bacterium]|jgi:peptide deformylase